LVGMAGLLFILSRRGAEGGLAMAGVVALAAFAFAAPAWAPVHGDRPAAVAEGPWQSFDEPAIAALVAEGKVVIVDITADWCLTCQVNKAAVLDRGAIRDRLGVTGIVAM